MMIIKILFWIFIFIIVYKYVEYSVLLYVPFENVGLSLEKDITLWLKNFPSNWKTTFNLDNNDLSIFFRSLQYI